jgi:hypothetical protein
VNFVSFIGTHVFCADRDHFKFNEQVAAAFVRYYDLKSLVEANCNGSEIKALGADLHLTITSSTNNVNFFTDGCNSSNCSGNFTTSGG